MAHHFDFAGIPPRNLILSLSMTTTTKRRWLSFSLRTLFVVVTVSAIPMAWLAWNVHQVRERERMLVLLKSRGAVFVSADNEGELPAFWSRLGAHPMAFIIIPEGACT